MVKQLIVAAAAGTALLAAYAVYSGHREAQQLQHVAPRVSMTYEALLSMGPRVAERSGASIGTAREVVYLLACSGVPTPVTLEPAATAAAGLVHNRGLGERAAVRMALDLHAKGAAASLAGLDGC